MRRISIRGATLAVAIATATSGLGAVGIAAASNDAPQVHDDAAVTSAYDVRGEIHQLQVEQAGARHTADLRAAQLRAAAAARKAELARAEAARQAAAQRASRDAYRRALYSGDPRTIARAMLANYGWGDGQWSCLDALWTRESSWQVHNTNPGSGAYGIPQALPGSKMAWAGSDWRDNPRTQIAWGLHYIALRYGTPCAAWSHSQNFDFY